MTEYEFELRFALPRADARPDEYVERLGASGCDDALIGIGRAGRVALLFTREAVSAHQAVRSAIADVERAVPGATLVEAAPDYVGLTDVAEILGFSRQNMRKLTVGCATACPAPIHAGRPSLWHLATILTWLRDQKQYEVPGPLLDLAHETMHVNIANELRRVDQLSRREIRSLPG